MASNVLTCSALPLLSNKAASNPAQMRLAPQCIVHRSATPLKTTPSSKVSSLVVRAQADEGGLSPIDPLMRKDLAYVDPLLQLHRNKTVAMIDTSPYMRTPWNTIEDEDEIRMSFDMPGLTASGIDVDVVNNLLMIKSTEGIDVFGRKIHNQFDCTLQLPFNCAKDETRAVLKNGILYISMPKITKAEHMKYIHVPVREI
ncbi:small heat shock protein, chloroplastic-like [Silene latifolia]|uniref:small heat shock protein, chloroplastic-like n=1 Tax=Silene latifolia TaxID=37657 RepID=UPI003D77E835